MVRVVGSGACHMEDEDEERGEEQECSLHLSAVSGVCSPACVSGAGDQADCTASHIKPRRVHQLQRPAEGENAREERVLNKCSQLQYNLDSNT